MSRELRESSKQRHVNENMQSREINQEQPHNLPNDNVVPFKQPNQLDKVQRILEKKKKQKNSWIRRFVLW